MRRANTTVELRNDQSFAIAGLLQNNSSDSKVQVPWISEVPILGALFRSSRYQRNETELVIIVTPRLVQPVSDISLLATPLDNVMAPGEADLFLGGMIEGQSARSRQPSSAPVSQLSEDTPTPTFEAVPAKGGMSAQYGHALQ